MRDLRLGSAAEFKAYALAALALTMLAGCAESVKHDEILAAKRALQFGQAVFVEKNFDKGYDLLADGGTAPCAARQFQAIPRRHARARLSDET